jgi:hypothetical protein
VLEASGVLLLEHPEADPQTLQRNMHQAKSIGVEVSAHDAGVEGGPVKWQKDAKVAVTVWSTSTLLIYRVVHTLTHIMLMKDEASSCCLSR